MSCLMGKKMKHKFQLADFRAGKGSKPLKGSKTKRILILKDHRILVLRMGDLILPPMPIAHGSLLLHCFQQ